jgi:hypothetical protein
VLVVIPLAGAPALVHDPRITWDILCSGALAKYTVTQRLAGGGVIATNPRPLSDHYTNVHWAAHFVLEPPTPSTPIIVGYPAPTTQPGPAQPAASMEQETGNDASADGRPGSRRR